MIRYNANDYNDLSNINTIIIKNDNNIIKTLNSIKNFDGTIIIEVDISKNNYDILKKIKDSYDLKIFINYTTSLCDKTLNSIDMCTLDKFLNLELILNRYVNNINSKNYTVLEKCIYAYDIVKLNKYRHTKGYDDEHMSIHETINSILHVCGSYAKILNMLFAKLGISSITYRSNYYYKHVDLLRIHFQNICYLKDDENNIDGIYYLNATADGVEDFNNYDEINKYNSFLISPDKIFKYKFQETVSEATCVYLNESYINKISEEMKEKSIMLFSKLLNIEINSFDELLNITKNYNRPIDRNKIINAIMNIRVKEGMIKKQEDYQNMVSSINLEFSKYDSNKKNSNNRYIFVNDNQDKVVSDITLESNEFYFDFNETYDRIDTLRK